MSVDSSEEAKYWLSLAGEHLHRAKEEIENFRRELSKIHLASCVAESQMCIESSAKTVISIFRVPSRAHDPSAELWEVLEEIRKKVKKETIDAIENLAGTASEVAPEHIRATYGDEKRKIPPSELYDEETATELLRSAEKAYETAEEFLGEWFS